jgi:putative sterol carrier protein
MASGEANTAAIPAVLRGCSTWPDDRRPSHFYVNYQLTTLTMPIPAFSADWAAAFRDAVNNDSGYRDAAKGWTNPVAMVIATGDGPAAGMAVQVDLQAGTCLSAAALHADDVSAPYVLSADLATWKEIVTGGSDPLMAVARGKVKLARGSLGTLMLHAKGAKALVACAKQIDTLWP